MQICMQVLLLVRRLAVLLVGFCFSGCVNRTGLDWTGWKFLLNEVHGLKEKSILLLEVSLHLKFLGTYNSSLHNRKHHQRQQQHQQERLSYMSLIPEGTTTS
jgi:hypothetical protein